MTEVIKTKLLEFEKSTFLVELVKTSNEKLYISLKQTVHKEGINIEPQEIKINPSIFPDLLATLNSFYQKIASQKVKFEEADKKELQKRYFSGVNIKDLAIQFDCTEELIEQLLTNDGIDIVSNEIPWHLQGRRRKQKKK